MPFCKRPGKPDLFYELDDFTDPWENAPYLILQHGYARNSKYWFQWVPYLSRYFKVVRPDLRGLGQSGKNFDFATELTPEEYLGDLRAIVKQLGDQPVHWCGESIGGILGLVFASCYPKLIRSLSILSSPVFINDAARKRFACGYSSWPEAVRKMSGDEWVKQTNNGYRFPPDAPDGLVEWYAKTLSAGTEMMACMAEFALKVNIEPYLAKIEAPVLALYPTGGMIADKEQEAILAKHIRNLRFMHIPCIYHAVGLVKLRQCVHQVLNFAAGVDGRVCDE
jgi:3-oxoadipate enol-lactonase